MRERYGFIEFDSKPGLGRGNDIAILPVNWALQNLRMEARPILYAFQNQEIRTAAANLNIGCAFDRPAIEMGCDLGIVRFRHSSDLLRFEKSADAPERHLQNRSGLQSQHPCEFVFRGQPLTSRD